MYKKARERNCAGYSSCSESSERRGRLRAAAAGKTEPRCPPGPGVRRAPRRLCFSSQDVALSNPTNTTL